MHEASTGVLLALTIVIAVGVLIQIGVLVAFAIGAMKTRQKIHLLLDHYQTQLAPHITPMVSTMRGLAEDVSPKVKVISSNLVDLSQTLKHETKHISATVNDMVGRTHQQATRVDDMVSGTLNGIDSATAAVQNGISIPLRRINGLLEGFRVGLNTLRRKEREGFRYEGQVHDRDE